MAFYKAKIFTVSIDYPDPIIVTERTTTSVTFTWDSVQYASSYQYTTDGGLTKATAQSGIAITNQSNGQALVAENTYYFQFRSYDNWSDMYSEWSPEIEVIMTPDVMPTVLTLQPMPRDRGFILRGFVYDDGGSVSGCTGWFILDGSETIHITGLHTNNYFLVFAFIDNTTDHTGKAVLQNLAGTSYGSLLHFRKEEKILYKFGEVV